MNDIERRNNLLKNRINSVGGMGSRSAVVEAGKYLSEEENIPYFWGGKFYEVGVCEDWNKIKKVSSEGSDIQFVGDEWPFGLDCSGFVSWAIINGGYKMNVSFTGDYYNYIKPNTMVFSVESLCSGKVKEGDLLFRKGHIALITDIDLDNNTIKVAEEKGAKYGMVVTNTTIDNFVNSNNYSDIYLMEDYYNDKNNLLDFLKSSTSIN